MEKPINSQEAKMMYALSMGIYGRPMQSRCSLLNNEQRERLRMAAMEMVQQGNPKGMEEDPFNEALIHEEQPSQNSNPEVA